MIVLDTRIDEALRAEGLARERMVEAQVKGEEARSEANKASALSSFLQDMLQAANPETAGGPTLTVAEVLDGAAIRLDEGALEDEPIAEAATIAAWRCARRRVTSSARPAPNVASPSTAQSPTSVARPRQKARSARRVRGALAIAARAIAPARSAARSTRSKPSTVPSQV